MKVMFILHPARLRRSLGVIAGLGTLLGAWACSAEDASRDGGSGGAADAGAAADSAAGVSTRGGTAGAFDGRAGDTTGESGESGAAGASATSGAPGLPPGNAGGHSGMTTDGDAGQPANDAGGGGVRSNDAGAGGAAPTDPGSAGEPNNGDAGQAGSDGSEPMPPRLNGCTNYVDRTAPSASRDILWDGSLPLQAERCMKIRLGDQPLFIGDFEEHPLAELGGDAPSPFATIPWTFDRPGVFGYFCTVHTEMLGAIWIVP
jgi:hypothetical protein